MFLKLSRLVIRRSVAAEICKAGAVAVNQVEAKPGREIRVGDIISIKRKGETLKVRVELLPTGNVSKSQAASLYELLSVEKYNEVASLLESSNEESSLEP